MTTGSVWREFEHDPLDPSYAGMRASDRDRPVVHDVLAWVLQWSPSDHSVTLLSLVQRHRHPRKRLGDRRYDKSAPDPHRSP